MTHSKRLAVFAAFLVLVFMVTAAPAESLLTDLWASGCGLLFDTDNVTVTGEVTFFLDGELFKTARIDYVQEGYKSYYALTLLTPWSDGSVREGGWTVIADADGGYCVMETYYPGTYRMGHGMAHDTLLRRSVQLDALIELGSAVAEQAAKEIPDSAVAVSESDGVRTIHLAVSENDIPDLAVSALNMAANFLCGRWFNYGFEHSAAPDASVAFEDYVSVTKALVDGTVRWVLRSADADFSLDAEGRLTAACGEITAASVFMDGSVRNVSAKFDLGMTDYGTSSVKTFDPEEYGVVLPQDLDAMSIYPTVEEEVWDDRTQRVDGLISSQGYDFASDKTYSGWYSEFGLNITVEDELGAQCYFAFSEDGALIAMQDLTAEWTNADEESAENVDAETVAAAVDWVRAFVSENYPALTECLDDLEAVYVMAPEDGYRYLSLEDVRGQTCQFIVRIEPSLRIEYYYGMAEE